MNLPHLTNSLHLHKINQGDKTGYQRGFLSIYIHRYPSAHLDHVNKRPMTKQALVCNCASA